MIEYEVAGQTYRATRKLDAFKQFAVSRRMAPLLAIMGAEVVALARAPKAPEADRTVRFVGLFPAVAEALSKMTDDDCNYILHNCLSVVQRRVKLDNSGGVGWQDVIAKGGVLMFADDIDMDVMLRIVFPVLQENLQGFLKGLGGNTPSPSS
jgi:hypothetical protein